MWTPGTSRPLTWHAAVVPTAALCMLVFWIPALICQILPASLSQYRTSTPQLLVGASDSAQYSVSLDPANEAYVLEASFSRSSTQNALVLIRPLTVATDPTLLLYAGPASDTGRRQLILSSAASQAAGCARLTSGFREAVVSFHYTYTANQDRCGQLTNPIADLQAVPSGDVASLSFHRGVPPVLLRSSKQSSWLWVYYLLLIFTGLCAFLSCSVHRRIRIAFPVGVLLSLLLPFFAILHGLADQIRGSAPGFCVFNLAMLFICLAAVPVLYTSVYAASFSTKRPIGSSEVAPEGGYASLPSARGAEVSPRASIVRETPRAPAPAPASARGSTHRRSSRVAPDSETDGAAEAIALVEGATALADEAELGQYGMNAPVSPSSEPERPPVPLTPRTQYRRTGVEEPAGDCKFFCPICMLFFPAMLKASCCAQYVCETCALSYVKGRHGFPRGAPDHILPERIPPMECPYCAVMGFQILTVDTEEEARKYEDSPGVQQKREALAQRRASGGAAAQAAPSPLKIGDSFDALKAKMITFEQAGYRGSVDAAGNGSHTPPAAPADGGGTPPRAAGQQQPAAASGSQNGAVGPLELDSITNSPLMLRRTVSRVASGGGGPGTGAAAAAALAAAAPPATPAPAHGRGVPPPPSPAAALRALALAETAGLVVYSMPNVPSHVPPSPSLAASGGAAIVSGPAVPGPNSIPQTPVSGGSGSGADREALHVVLVGPGMLAGRPGSAGSVYSPMRPPRLAAVEEEEGHQPPQADPGSRRSDDAAAPPAGLPPRPRSRTDVAIGMAAASLVDTNRSRSSNGSSRGARRHSGGMAPADLPHSVRD